VGELAGVRRAGTDGRRNACRAAVVRGRIPGSLIDCNRRIDVSATDFKAGIGAIWMAVRRDLVADPLRRWGRVAPRPILRPPSATMDPWSKLAEARIQEWMARPERERVGVPGNALSVAPLEVQLLDDARSLYAGARGWHDADEAALMREAAARVETRIMVLLEASSRPLAAQQFARMLAEERAKR
jgi:hypothetical protein